MTRRYFLRAPFLAGVLLAGAASAGPEEVRFTGETSADELLVHDALQFLVLYVREHLDCPALQQVEAHVLPPGAVQRDPKEPEGTGPATYERWNVTFCERQQPFTLVFWPGKNGGTMFRAEVRDACAWVSKFVSASSAPLAPRRFRTITGEMPTSGIVGALGPAARDVGSGLHVLEWDVNDGRVFYVSTTDICAKPTALGFRDAPPPEITPPS